MTPDDDREQRRREAQRQQSLRAWIKQLADEYDVSTDDVLIQSQRRDPMNKGTDADHAKAQWFARLWNRAVDHLDDDQIHVRGVHYWVYMSDLDVEPPTDCSWNTYENTQRCYDYLEECAVLARILGYIPLDGIVDKRAETRTVTRYGAHTKAPDRDSIRTPTGVQTPNIPPPDARAELTFDPQQPGSEDVVDAYAEWAADRVARRARDQLSFDEASQSPYHIEIWSEKTLPEYIRAEDGVAASHGCNVIVEGEGDLSLTVAQDLAERIESAGKPAVILYLADHDAKGWEMPTNMAAKIAWLTHRGDLQQRVVVERLAITPEQIKRLGLPRKPIEGADGDGTGALAHETMVNDWERRHGAGATELDALKQHPKEFRSIVRDALTRYEDPDIPTENAVQKDDWESEVQERVHEQLLDAEIDEEMDELLACLQEFNDALEEVADVFAELREMLGEDSAVSTWESVVQEAIGEAELPVASVPEGEAALPEDPLYDSDRSYIENKMRIDRYRDGG